MDWKREIVVAHMVKQKIAEVDTKQIWSYPLPEVAATEVAIADVERALGFGLDSCYRSFLRHANGWKSFFQAVSVFGTSDLVKGPLHERAVELLESLEDLETLCGFNRAELMPFAVSEIDIDVFVISRPNSQTPGIVLWFAGQLIDKFPNFNEWFLSMVDYNRREYQRIIGHL